MRSRGFPVRVASRHPDQGHRLSGRDDPQLQSVGTNIHDERSVADALAGAYGVVDAVSLYVEHSQETFQLIRASHADVSWLQQTLDRDSQRLGVRISFTSDGRLTLSWAPAS
ncbi:MULTISPECIES: hypothetical protein [unclassified Bradyrhizobium]|uniref:hypothetical protein n=1 Tax=unclassified Bradyrhizobium TaxID=2631580 RepID=UPI00247A0140|nr:MULTISPECIES: hypothetical protein [unclassified Bradyrhizobium]WGS23983.1 SDR family oxidoreductase [Bradyrhizobium sp. ISRA463]WGS31292.1 SDR family oxidoreductase [Bradyrhizobium sp. ISRA464]